MPLTRASSVATMRFQPAQHKKPKRKALGPASGNAVKRPRSSSTPFGKPNVSITDVRSAATVPAPASELYVKNEGACFDVLSDEIVREVCLFLPNKPLAALSQVNKKCCGIASEVLYADVTLVPNRTNYFAMKLAAMAENLALAEYVKTIEIDGMPYVVGGQDLSKVFRNDLVLVLAQATKLRKATLTEKWVGDHWDDRAGFIRHIGWLKTFKDATVDVYDISVNHFSNLRELKIISPNMTIQDLAFAFRLPSLKHLTLEDVCQTSPIHWDIADSSCNVETLVLNRVFVCSEAVKQCLVAVKTLRRMEYIYSSSAFEPFSPENNPKAYWAEFSYSNVAAGLAKHKDSLETLFVEHPNDSELLGILNPGEANFGTLGSLHEFPQLSHICIPSLTYITEDVIVDGASAHLPPQMESLETGFDPRYGATANTCLIASLKDVQWTGKEPFIIVNVDYPLRFKDLQLSSVLERSLALGVPVHVYDSDGQHLPMLEIRSRENMGVRHTARNNGASGNIALNSNFQSVNLGDN